MNTEKSLYPVGRYVANAHTYMLEVSELLRKKYGTTISMILWVRGSSGPYCKTNLKLFFLLLKTNKIMKTTQNLQREYFQASTTPQQDLLTVAYPGQPAHMRRYMPGYEWMFNQLIKLDEHSPFLVTQLSHNIGVMAELAGLLRNDPAVTSPEMMPGKGGFLRTIIGMESPVVQNMENQPYIKEGAEVLIASWGDGMTSPVHGHSAGMLYENILYGKMMVNTYQLVDPMRATVRLISSEITGPGEFVAQHRRDQKGQHFKRQHLIHNFTSIGNSASLHFVPEHTRDGRDNTFQVEYFDDRIKLTTDDVVRISAMEGMYLQPGDVALVRSSNVPEYGDHYIVVTGHPIMKPHGMRPQETSLIAPTNTLLDQYENTMGLVVLKLKDYARNQFLNFHNIYFDEVDREVRFPVA